MLKWNTIKTRLRFTETQW